MRTRLRNIDGFWWAVIAVHAAIVVGWFAGLGPVN